MDYDFSGFENAESARQLREGLVGKITGIGNSMTPHLKSRQAVICIPVTDETEVQMAREKAERQRAKVDKAYMEEMHLSAHDFISLKWIETIAAKNGANIDVMVGSDANPMWNIRR